LHLLVALTRQQHNIARSGLLNCRLHRLSAIRLHMVRRAGALQTGECVVDNPQRIFTSGIVRSKHDEITTPSCRFTHEGTLGAVAVTAATKKCNHSIFSALRNKFPGEGCEVSQSVICMRVSNYHRERLSAFHHLETTRNTS